MIDYVAEYDRYHRMTDTSFGGIRVSQHLCDLILWEWILNKNRQIGAIFELGTWKGGFSWWLWAQTQVRRIEFKSYDTIPPINPPPGFQINDVIRNHKSIGQYMRDYEPCLVFCDNGNKPLEMEIYSHELDSPYSILIVHDWHTEFFEKDIPHNVKMIYADFCEEIGSFSRVFKLK